MKQNTKMGAGNSSEVMKVTPVRVKKFQDRN